MPDSLTDKNKAPYFQKKSWLTDWQSYCSTYEFLKLCLTDKNKAPYILKKSWPKDWQSYQNVYEFSKLCLRDKNKAPYLFKKNWLTEAWQFVYFSKNHKLTDERQKPIKSFKIVVWQTDRGTAIHISFLKSLADRWQTDRQNNT